MTQFTITTPETAPPAARETLKAIGEAVGFVPNVYGLIANSPAALTGLAALNAAFAGTSFTPAECEIIALTTSVYNQCPYCVAGHSAFAVDCGVDRETIDAVRDGGFARDPRLRALGQITFRILETRGAIQQGDIQPFLKAGFEPFQLLDLLVGVAGKTMTNFASKLAGITLDNQFADHAWSPTQRSHAA